MAEVALNGTRDNRTYKKGTGWRAGLSLQVSLYGEKTILGRTRHYGPLRVQRPFYPEGEGLSHLYILHPPGGLVAGDELVQTVKVEAGAATLVTTPAAGKLYFNKTGESQIQKVELSVGTQGSLEWLPQETILYEGSKAELRTTVSLAEGARYIGWDIFCLGRQASGESFDQGQLLQTVNISRSDNPLFLERFRLGPGDSRAGNLLGLSGQRVFGTLLATLEDGSSIPAWHEQLVAMGFGKEVALTCRNGIFIVRYLGSSSARARTVFLRVWRWCRPAVNGRAACRPRIWNT